MKRTFRCCCQITKKKKKSGEFPCRARVPKAEDESFKVILIKREKIQGLQVCCGGHKKDKKKKNRKKERKKNLLAR